MTGGSQRQAAIVGGMSILIMAVAAVFATDATMGRLLVPDDAAATARNVVASEGLFRVGVLSWLVVLICDVLAAWGLYEYMKPVSRSLSLLTGLFRLVYVSLLGTALLGYVAVLSMLGADAVVGFGTEQLAARVFLGMRFFEEMWSVGLVVFGGHILGLGVLVWRSGYTPRSLGVLLMLACIGYVVPNLLKLVVPEMRGVVQLMGWLFIVPMVVGEVGLGVWLLVRGRKVDLELGGSAAT